MMHSRFLPGDDTASGHLHAHTGNLVSTIWTESVADLCSYPELEADSVEPDIQAQCMDCDHKTELRDFFPGDVNA